MPKNFSNKDFLIACGILCCIVVATVVASMIFVVYTSHKFQPKFAEFELIDATFQTMTGNKENDTKMYILTATISASNPNKDTYRISLANPVGTAFYANKTFADAKIVSPTTVTEVGPTAETNISTVFVGSTAEMRNDMTRHGMQFMIYGFVVNVLMQEIVSGKNYKSIVSQGKYEITCDFEVGLSDPNLNTTFHQSSKCLSKHVSSTIGDYYH